MPELSEQKRRILITDDSDINRMMLVEMLSQDYELMEAADGDEAMEILKGAHPYVGFINGKSFIDGEVLGSLGIISIERQLSEFFAHGTVIAIVGLKRRLIEAVAVGHRGVGHRLGDH